jgi:outer membrane receptor protein involved in Fe transport
MDIRYTRVSLACLMAGMALSPLAQADDQPTGQLGAIEVTATPMPEHLGTVPQSIDVITHDQLEALHAMDLRSALSLAAGVDIGPGGDNGPAASVPQFQGLAEFDAFLLLVDGVPVGGAFNPDLASVDLTGVDRIEVIRGSAPVKYGATSFVGVINVIHVKAGTPGSEAGASIGSHGSYSASIVAPLSSDGTVKQSIIADHTDQEFSDPRAGWGRSHVLFRSAIATESGEFRLDLDGMSIRQDPASPTPLAPGDTALTALVPVDSNQNPSDARMDEDRVGITLADDADLKWAQWSTTFSTVFTHNRNIRGFLRADQLTDTGAPNADGFDQSEDRTDIYFDSHLTFPAKDDMSFVAGFSLLQGSGSQASSNFEYFIHLDGSNPPLSTSVPVDERTRLSDRRTFSGIYGEMDWAFAPRWDYVLGLQLNHDVESTDTAFLPSDPAEQAELDGDHRSDTRVSGMTALSYQAWTDGADDMVLYGNYRYTFKPAAIDFGPEAEPDILEPETAQQYELGLKGVAMQGSLDWEASWFLTNMNNTVVAVDNGGTPGIANGGQQRFTGIELEADWRFSGDWRWQAGYSYHKATYRNFLHDTDGTPAGLVQDAGNRLELSPLDLFQTGLFWMPVRGFNLNAVVHYVGSRYFDPENSVSTGAYTTFDAGVGYRFDTWRINLEGRNLNDRRDPVSNSELGDSQSYLLPGRFIELSAAFDF